MPPKRPVIPLCCDKPIQIKPLATSENNPQITKAMRYSQYIKNSKNSKTVYYTASPFIG
jgi:hypothetical protein